MFPLLTIEGEPHLRGRQYGAQAAPLIRRSIANYARLFAYRRGLDWAAIREAALAYAPVLADVAPDLLAEMRGIAEGAGQELDAIVALNARTELLAGGARLVGSAHPGYAAAIARNRAAGVPQPADESAAAGAATGQADPGECTTVAALPGATADGRTLLAQTWDWNGDQRAACVLLRVSAPGKPALLTLTEAGIVAKIGLNRAGLGVCLNILRSHADGQRPGLPVHVLLRQVLEASSLEEALDRVMAAAAGASSCVTIADAQGRAVSLEVTPGGVGALEPAAGLLAHTNHCVIAETRAGECAHDPTSSSVPRYNRALELLRSGQGRLDAAALQALLCDHHAAPFCICRHPDPRLPAPDRTESVTAVVMDLTARSMDVAPDVPCQAAFAPVGW